MISISAEAPNFVKAKHVDPSLGFGYDYDVVNSDIILHSLSVKDRKLVLPHGRFYRVLVLPEQERMNPDVLEKIVDLVQQGAVVIGDKPSRSHSLINFHQRDQRVKKLADQLWGGQAAKSKNRVGKGVVYSRAFSIRKVLEDIDLQPDLQVLGKNDSALYQIMRNMQQTQQGRLCQDINRV